MSVQLLMCGHSVDFHSYADNTQLGISVGPDSDYNVNALLVCWTDIIFRMFRNVIK